MVELSVVSWLPPTVSFRVAKGGQVPIAENAPTGPTESSPGQTGAASAALGYNRFKRAIALNGQWNYWQGGYDAFSVSQSAVANVLEYIANHAVHHATRTFQDELRSLLVRHEIECDERYVWD